MLGVRRAVCAAVHDAHVQSPRRRLLTLHHLTQGDDGDAAMAVLTPGIRRAIAHEPAAYRLAVFGILHGSDAPMVGALVRCAAVS